MFIYKLRHKLDTIDENIYVGYTKDLAKRLKYHKDKSKETPGRLVYKYVLENGGWDNFELIVLCECDEKNKNILEQYFMDELKPTLNMSRSIVLPQKERSAKYYNENIEQNRAKALERYYAKHEENKKKMLERYHAKKNIQN